MATPTKSDLLARLQPFGQEHLLADWDRLDEARQQSFAEELASLDLPLLRRLFAQASQQEAAATGELLPPEVVGVPETIEQIEQQVDAAVAGEALLEEGRVGMVMVAGGQGSRLGHPGPKGTYPIGPVTERSLFQIHAEKVLALSRAHGHPIPLLIMTSPENDTETRAFFQRHESFGLQPEQVTFFQQGMLPALDAATGEILRAGPGQLAFSPNGHGGTLEALHRGGHLQRLKEQGISVLFYFQVDNPLVKIADETFLGLFQQMQAEVAVKVVRKTDPEERIGLVVRRAGRVEVVEYSELASELAHARDAAGGLRLWAGNTAIHLFSIEFLLRLADGETILPFHIARKSMPCWHNGETVRPATPNALKFEMFIFDALPMASRVLLMETLRQEEFEPLKNANGEYSPSSVRAALSRLYAAWLEQAGVLVKVGPEGVPPPLEISPLVAMGPADLREKLAGISEVTGPMVLGPGFALPAMNEVDAAEDDE